MAAGGDGADVPDHRPLGVEVGGADQQQAALLVLARDGIEHLLVGVAGDHLGQRAGVGHGIVEQGGGEAARAEDLVGGHGRIDVAQRVVVGGSEKGEGRDQGAGADAGHHLEFRPRAERRPAVHQPGTEGAVVAAAGDRKIVDRRQARGGLALGRAAPPVRARTRAWLHRSWPSDRHRRRNAHWECRAAGHGRYRRPAPRCRVPGSSRRRGRGCQPATPRTTKICADPNVPPQRSSALRETWRRPRRVVPCGAFFFRSSKRCRTTKNDGTNSTARQVEASMPLNTVMPMRDARSGAGPGGDDQRQHAEDEGERGHQDRPEAGAGRFMAAARRSPCRRAGAARARPRRSGWRSCSQARSAGPARSGCRRCSPTPDSVRAATGPRAPAAPPASPRAAPTSSRTGPRARVDQQDGQPEHHVDLVADAASPGRTSPVQS